MATVDCNPLTKYEASIVRRATAILERKTKRKSVGLNAPSLVRELLVTRYAVAPREVFAVLFLDAQNCLIEFEELFHGTLTQTSVFPREVVKAALHHNAASVFLVHNHPSGVPEPSHEDKRLTLVLKDALALVDVRVLDHFIVGGSQVMSFSEQGLLDFIPPTAKVAALRPTAKKSKGRG